MVQLVQCFVSLTLTQHLLGHWFKNGYSEETTMDLDVVDKMLAVFAEKEEYLLHEMLDSKMELVALAGAGPGVAQQDTSADRSSNPNAGMSAENVASNDGDTSSSSDRFPVQTAPYFHDEEYIAEGFSHLPSDHRRYLYTYMSRVIAKMVLWRRA